MSAMKKGEFITNQYYVQLDVAMEGVDCLCLEGEPWDRIRRYNF